MIGTSISQWTLAQEQVHHYFVMLSVRGVNLPWTNASISQLKTRPAMQLELCVLVWHILLCSHYGQIFILLCPVAPCSRFHTECSAIGEDELYSFVEFCFCSQYCYLYEKWNADDRVFDQKGDCCRDILQLDNCFSM